MKGEIIMSQLIKIRNPIAIMWWIWPSLRSKKLSEDEINRLNKYGIVHFTTEEGKKSIIQSKRIYPSSSFKSYSNKGIPSCFFFLNDDISDDEIFMNIEKEKNIAIYISKITENQIRKMKYRQMDNTIVYEGDFILEQENEISFKKYKNIIKKHSAKDTIVGLKMLFSLFVCAILVSLLMLIILWLI